VHLRGLVEISNECRRRCAYCGLRGPNRRVERYRMSHEAILACAALARRLGLGTLVLQSGEAEEADDPALEALLRALGALPPPNPAITLSLGEAEAERYARWRQAGASRYLLKFETSDRTLYQRLHPHRQVGLVDRVRLVRALQNLGYEVGSGIMVGLPGQTWASVARDLELCRDLDLDMIAVGPYIPHPETPLGRALLADVRPYGDQVPHTLAAACRVIALARILCPHANIPSATGLTVVAHDGTEQGLRAGANVIMINLAPVHYQRAYDLYPGRSVLDPIQVHADILRLLSRLELAPSVGPGGRRSRDTVAPPPP
jgi:biotin synthase